MVKKCTTIGTDLKQVHDNLLQERYDRNIFLPEKSVKEYKEELKKKNKPT